MMDLSFAASAPPVTLTAASAPPPVTLYPGANNVYGRAQYEKDSGVVKFLGRFNQTSQCANACTTYKNQTAVGEVCFSFTHHLPDFPTDWKGLCFGITDHSWTPVPDSSDPPIITSGMIAREEEEQPCSTDPDVATVRGCSWQVDPWCLDGGSVYKTATLTTADALSQCAADDTCRGVAFVQVTPGKVGPTSTKPLQHTFHNTTKGGPGSCWAHRRHFALQDDPFRTWFHYQPAAHWMNDPNGPMYHNGVYHLFHQYNPISLQGFANMHWGHAVSTDMVRWKQIATALAPDVGNECGGEWSGSATPAARIGAHDNVSAHTGPVLSFSVQCNSFFGQAEPADPTDPLLTNWTKPKYNPTAHKPSYVPGGFRDPSEAFLGSDGLWRQLAACTGGACLFTSKDFTKWDAAGYAFYGPYGPSPGPPPSPPPSSSSPPSPAAPALTRADVAGDPTDGPPTWECPDLFVLPPAAGTSRDAEQLWVFKASGALTPATAAKGVDFWSTGHFNETTGRFVVGPHSQPVPNDFQRVDYGSFYASKTFYDPAGAGRVVIGWVEEAADVPLLDWASVQSVPRQIQLDPRRPGQLLFSPIAALETLRVMPPGLLGPTLLRRRTVHSLASSWGGEHLDLLLRLPAALPAGSCVGASVLGGAANATITIANASSAHVNLGGHVGPFAVSAAPLELRVLVDSSIVEAFADGGRASVTHRVYPMAAAPVRGAITLVNCGDEDVQIEGLEAFQMARATPPSEGELRARARAAMTAI